MHPCRVVYKSKYHKETGLVDATKISKFILFQFYASTNLSFPEESKRFQFVTVSGNVHVKEWVQTAYALAR